jgi:type I restriction enzyme M protein
MLFLVNMLSKMKQDTALGSRIAHVHNGSALFTGDAGSGESNIRRWIIENDWLEAIIQLPDNIFYNTGISTYIWILSNRKEERRKGKIQLIDANKWFAPLRKNLGDRNCELTEDHIRKIVNVFTRFEKTEESKIYPNASFGYYKVTVERPLRAKDIDPETAYKAAEIKALKDTGKISSDGAPVIKKIHGSHAESEPLKGLFAQEIKGKNRVVEYEPDPDLRDTEQVPLLHQGGIEAFIRTEVLPYAPDAWVDDSKTKIGYEISFNKYFYKPIPLRTIKEIVADIEALEKEGDGLLSEIIGDLIK